MKIFVCCHASADIPAAEYLVPLHVGAAGKPPLPGCPARDDRGDNISAKNQGYCELTGLYWIWRNTPGEDVVGLCHYRRYFAPVDIDGSLGLAMGRGALEQAVAAPDSAARLASAMEACNVVTSRPHPIDGGSIAEHFIYFHGDLPWHAAMVGLRHAQPGEAKAAEAFFNTSRAFYAYNMAIFRRPALDAYCSWLFPVLAAIERALPPIDDPYQRRAIGFLGERLFTWWLCSRRPRLVERQILRLEE